ncbi:hypothetical protein [Paracoccus sp. DMF]|uniref:hypothetical protein n=1 Tax=Paracoccus sp. DMF TaxID=400837 RepID=UPI0021E45EA7|nr:hypothetical protein [Paracoccus sp. DMF]MCV2447074.1 hypothetical protein [Paracoccus sp. DMF]
MIPLANPIQSRAGPAAAPQLRPGDAAGPTIAAAEAEIPPVEESAAASADVQLGHEGIGHAREATQGETRRVAPTKSAVEDSDGPQDRAVFRAKVIKFLNAMYGDDEAFQRALKLGTIVVRAVEDQPEPEMRPELTYAIYREGAALAAAEEVQRRAGGPPVSVGPNDFVAWWPK